MKPPQTIEDMNLEVKMLLRRIEIMEEQAEEKERNFREGKEPLLREINKLQRDLKDEREESNR